MKFFDHPYFSRQNRHHLVGVLLIIFYSVGFFGFNFPATIPLFLKLTPYTLLLSFTVLLSFHRPWNFKFILLGLFIMIAGYSVEAIGVSTGLIFGSYTYGPNLGVKLWHTPPMIGINWLMLTYIGYIFFKNRPWPIYVKILAGAAVLVGYDVILEPMAMKLYMWDWENGVIPFQNYAAWFVLSVFFISLFYMLRIEASNKIAAAVFFVQVGFFVILEGLFRIFGTILTP
jgi:putative membrane protein